ncbi:MAG: hypothetical protein LBT89_05645, partial [Planctomycetaceae bacterium]|nr:hypothetical protein [Planctomycetaceae bacterium]
MPIRIGEMPNLSAILVGNQPLRKVMVGADTVWQKYRNPVLPDVSDVSLESLEYAGKKLTAENRAGNLFFPMKFPTFRPQNIDFYRNALTFIAEGITGLTLQSIDAALVADIDKFKVLFPMHFFYAMPPRGYEFERKLTFIAEGLPTLESIDRRLVATMGTNLWDLKFPMQFFEEKRNDIWYRNALTFFTEETTVVLMRNGYRVRANGTPDGTGTTLLYLEFDMPTTLQPQNIEIVPLSGNAAPLTLSSNSATEYLLSVGSVLQGEIAVRIVNRDDIDPMPHLVTVYAEGGVPANDYIVEANGVHAEQDTTELTFTFEEEVIGLTSADIIIRPGSGQIRKGIISGSGTEWTLTVSVDIAGEVGVVILKGSINAQQHNVVVNKYNPNTTTYNVSCNGTAGLISSTRLIFTFSQPVSGLDANSVILFPGTGQAVRGQFAEGSGGTHWELLIGVISEGTISVIIGYAGIDESEHAAMVYKGMQVGMSYTVTANGTEDTLTSTALLFNFEPPVAPENFTVTSKTSNTV